MSAPFFEDSLVFSVAPEALPLSVALSALSETDCDVAADTSFLSSAQDVNTAALINSAKMTAVIFFLILPSFIFCWSIIFYPAKLAQEFFRMINKTFYGSVNYQCRI